MTIIPYKIHVTVNINTHFTWIFTILLFIEHTLIFDYNKYVFVLYFNRNQSDKKTLDD